MAILYSKDLTAAKNKLPIVGIDLMLQIITGLGVQYLTTWAKHYKIKTFRSLYGHALLILTKSSQFLEKSKIQVVHEQKFKDPINSTCQFSSYGLALDS